MKKCLATLLYITAVICSALPLTVHAATPGMVRWHNEDADTTRINNILSEVSRQDVTDINDLMVTIGEKLIGTPYSRGFTRDSHGEFRRDGLHYVCRDCGGLGYDH